MTDIRQYQFKIEKSWKSILQVSIQCIFRKVIVPLISQQNVFIQYNTCIIIIGTILCGSTFIAPSSGRTLSYAQNYCYNDWLQILSYII